MKTYLLGWTNIRFLIKELIKIYSHKDSFFSKKRIESGIAFIVLQWGMIHWLVLKVNSIDVTSLIMWAGVEGAVAGYMIKKIQEEKKPE